MTPECFDLVVIGTGPAGHHGAIQATKLGKKVLAVEAHDVFGGVSVNMGTIPSKGLREATMHLSGLRQRSFYGAYYQVKDDVTIDDLAIRTDQIVRNETAVHESQLRRNGVRLLRGQASFISPRQIVVEGPRGIQMVEADHVLLAVGSSPAQPPGFDFDGERILDSNQILGLKTLPGSLIIVGAGVIGIEYACIFSALGVSVTVVNKEPHFLEFVDQQIVEVLKYHMQNQNVHFRLGEEVVDLERRENGVVARTQSNKELVADCLLYSVGRQGNTESLNLESAGLEADHRGRISVDGNYQTAVPHIYAAGDVVGFPSLASAAREQGRRAICHAFGNCAITVPSKLPFGIYAIPEISMFGPTEQELTQQAIPYEVGRARYREIARGQIVGDTDGLLKILFHRETLGILGVHIVGEGATELIHIGQAVDALGGTLEYFVDAVFNYPTLAECYKVAALDGINRAGKLSRADETEDVRDPIEA